MQLVMIWACFHFLWVRAESSKDFLVTNFGKQEILQMNESDVVIQTYKFFPDTEIENFQARCHHDKLMLIWVDKTEFIIRYINSRSFMTPPDNLQFNSDAVFDVQADGDFLVMSVINGPQTEISIGNFNNSKVESVLTIDVYLKTVAIHPRERIIYYVTCQGSSFSLTVFDVDSKKVLQRFAPPQCLDGLVYDDENDILWAFDGNQIYEGSLNDEKFEIIYERDMGMISSVALGSKDLLIMHDRGGGSQMYHLTLKPMPLKQLALPSFTITPFIGLLKYNFFLLDVDNQHLILYDDEFKEIWKNKITVESKPVASVNGISRADGSWEFYWIHPTNAGKMEAVFISPTGTVAREKTLQFGDKDIADFSIHGRTNTFFLAVNTSIYLSPANASSANQEVESFYDLERPLKAILSLNFALMVTFCDESRTGFSSLSIRNPSEPLPHETVVCFDDIQALSVNPYFASSNGIYAASPKMDAFEKLFDARNITSIAVYNDQIYFVASLDDIGPGIYKMAKSRSRPVQTYYGASSDNFVTQIKGNCEMPETSTKAEVQLTSIFSSPQSTKGYSQSTETRTEVTKSSIPRDSTLVKSSNSGNSASKLISNFHLFVIFAELLSLFLYFKNIL